jgi:hypothetical protein
MGAFEITRSQVQHGHYLSGRQPICRSAGPGIDLTAAVGHDRCVDDKEEFPADGIERPDSSTVRIRSVNGWTLIVRRDPATRLVSLGTEDSEGRLVGSRILGMDDCQLLVNALHEALEQNRTSGEPVMIDVSQVIGRD